MISTAANLDRELDERQRRKAGTLRTLHAVSIPALRIFGYLALSTFAFWDCQLQGIAWDTHLPWVIGAYCLVSWAVLALGYGRTGPLDLGLTFLMLDVIPFCHIVMVTGAERSWLTLVLLVRVADQVGFGFWRSVWVTVYVVAVLLCFYEMRSLSGHALDWNVALMRALMLGGAGLYIAAVAKVVEALRRKTEHAMRTARELLIQLESRNEELTYAREQAEQNAQANQTVVLLREASSNLLQTSSQVDQSLEEQTRALESQWLGVKRVRDALAEVAQSQKFLEGNYIELSQSVESTLQQAEGGGRALEQLNGLLQSIREESLDIQRDLQSAEVALNEIGQQEKVIQNLAAKAKLLSLNAAIQSSIHGSGHGFAAISLEFQRLAEQLAGLDGDIHSLTARVEVSTQKTRRGIRRFQENTEQVFESSQVQSRVLDGILTQAKDMSKATRSLLLAVDSQGAITESIHSSLRGVDSAQVSAKAAVSSLQSSLTGLERALDLVREAQCLT